MSLGSYTEKIAHFVNNDEISIFFYWKARVALFALLECMGVEEGDEVILPAYTCVVVPNAILYLGAKPVYVDVKKETYNMDVSLVNDAITDRTKVIICQNTYGLSSDLHELVRIAKENHLYTVEDCTHGFGGTYEGIPNGLVCDAAIYSTQWNKPFSTGIGGFAIMRNQKLSECLSVLNSELVSPSFMELLNLKALYLVKRFFINDVTYWPLIRFYRWLSRNNIVVGSSSGEEIISTSMPEGYFKKFSGVQAKEGLKNLPNLADDLVLRKKNALIYSNFLIELGKNHVPRNVFNNHSFLKYPLLVKQRNQFIELAEKHRITLGEWFVSPLHPVEGDLIAWGFDKSEFPVSEYLSSHVVNLPTTPSNINRVLSFLETHADHVI